MQMNGCHFASCHLISLHCVVPIPPPPSMSEKGKLVLAEWPRHHGQTQDFTPCLKSGHTSDLSQDTFDIRILMAKSVKYTVNFLEAKEGDLHRYWHPCPVLLGLAPAGGQGHSWLPQAEFSSPGQAGRALKTQHPSTPLLSWQPLFS